MRKGNTCKWFALFPKWPRQKGLYESIALYGVYSQLSYAGQERRGKALGQVKPSDSWHGQWGGATGW